MHWSYIFLELSLRYRDGSILLNCAITKDNQPKIEYHDHFQIKNILRNLQYTSFISLINQSPLGITIVLHFCLFCVIAVAIFWWAKSLWLHVHSMSRWGPPRPALEVYSICMSTKSIKILHVLVMHLSRIHCQSQKLYLHLTKQPFWRLLIIIQYDTRNLV